MITGEQLREVLRLLGWTPLELAEKAALRATVVLDGLASSRSVRLSTGEEARLREVLGEVGVIILDRHRDDLGVRRLPD